MAFENLGKPRDTTRVVLFDRPSQERENWYGVPDDPEFPYNVAIKPYTGE
jgi:hypothetical protein